MRKKKKLIIILSIVGLILGVIGGIGAYFIIESNKPPVELEDTEAKYNTTLKEAPTDGSLPTEHDALDVIAYTLWTVANSSEFKVITTGIADAGITTQDISNERVVKNGEAMVSTISSGLISLGTQRFFFEQSQNKVLSRTADKIEGLNAIWNSKDAPECVTYKEMRRRYGWYPFQANGYIICEDTYLNKDQIKVIDNGNGTYSINFSLDPDGEKAPFWYRREVITSSGSTMVPIFTSINMNFTIDSTYHLLKQDIKEEYTVKAMGVEATTNTDVSDVFTYDNVEFNKEYYDWFMQYKSLVPVADKETDEIEAKEDDIMTMVVSSLQTSDNSNIKLKLNANVKGLAINGLATLNINDLNNVYVLANLEDLIYVEYSNNELYLAIGDTKYKISLADLSLPAANENSNNALDVDAILNDLNSGTVTTDGDNKLINTTLNILGIKLDLFFNINATDGKYSLNNAKANANISGIDIEIVIEKVNEEVEIKDHTEFTELDLNQLIDNIKDIIDNKELNVIANLKINDIIADLDLNISFSEQLFIDAILKLNINGTQIEINAVLENNILYIAYGDIKISLNIDDIKYIASLFTDINTNDLLSQFDISKINISEIISNIKKLSIETLDKETDLLVAYDNIELSAKVLNKTVDKEFDHSNYTDLSNIINYVKNSLTKAEASKLITNIKNIINNKELGINLDLDFNGTLINVAGDLSFKDELFLNAKANINIDGTNLDINIVISNNIVYLSLNDIKVSLELNDIIYFVNLLLDQNIDLNNFDISSILGVLDTNNAINLDAIISNIKNINFDVLDNNTKLDVTYDIINASINLLNKNVNKDFNSLGYTDLTDIINYLKTSLTKEEAKNLITNLKNIITNKELGINIEISNSDLSLGLDGYLSFNDGLYISASANVKYKTLELPLEIIFDGSYAYIKLDNIKVSVSKNSMMGMLKLFMGNSLDLSSLDLNNVLANIKSLDLDSLDTITSLFLTYDALLIEANIDANPTKRLDDTEGYSDLSGLIDDVIASLDSEDIDDLTSIISKIIDFAKEKEFYINLDLSLEKNNAKYLDITGFVKFFVYENGRFDLEIKATIVEYEEAQIKMTHNLDLKLLAKEYFIANNINEFNEDYLFITYGTNPSAPNNLIKAKTPAKDLLGVLGTLTQLLGVDLTFLSNYSTFNFNEIDATQIRNLFSSDNKITIDFDNLINQFEVNDLSLNIDLNLSSLLGSNNESTKMYLDVFDNETKKAVITLNDLYINDNLKIEIKDISLLKEAVYIDLPNTNGWYDISSLDELVSALLVTATNKDFEIKGEIQLTAIGIPAIKADTHVKVNVYDDGSFALYAKLDFSGVGTLITNNWCEIYYSDGYVIIRSYKSHLFKADVDKAIKVTAEDFLKDIKYYLISFGIGLSESLINSMESSEVSGNQDASKVLTKYNYDNGIYNIGLNLGELTGVSGLENLEIGLSLSEMTVNDNLTADAITSINSLSLKLYTVLTVKLSAPISLTNIEKGSDGKYRFTSVDMTNELNYFNSYPYEVGVEHRY